MVTLVKERERAEVDTGYPELPGLPNNMIGFCPLRHTIPNGWTPDMPLKVQKAIAGAVPIFGMTIRVFYPEKTGGICKWHSRPLWRPKGDPMVIGEKDGRFYLIAAWE